MLKVDRLGRVRTTAERRQALLEEFDRSGVSAAQFAKVTGVNYQTFATWVQKRARERASNCTTPERSPTAIRFLEAVMEPAPQCVAATHDGLILYAGSEIRMEVRTGAQALLAAQVLRALQNGGREAC